MSSLIAILKDIILTLTLNPASMALMFTVVVLSVVAGWFGFSKMVTALKFPMNNGIRPIVSLGAMIILCLAAAVISKAYISPRLSSGVISRFCPLIGALIVFLAAVVPLTCFLLKSKYLQTISAFLVPIIAAAIVVFLAKGLTGAVKQGEAGFTTSKKRTKDMDEVILK